MTALLNSKCKAGILVAACVSLALCSSCTDENVYDTGGDKDVIGFAMTAASEDGNTPQSRAAHSTEPSVLLYARNSDSLYLHTTITDNPSPVSESPKTRGVPVTNDNFKSVYGAFGVKAYVNGSTLYMNDKVSPESNGVWSPDGGKRFWPNSKVLDFYACAPYEYNGKNPLADGTASYSDQKISFSYTVPTTADGNDAKAQPDLMFAVASHSVETTTNGCVPLIFHHALAGIKFVVCDIAGGTVESISLKGVYGAGNCTYDSSDFAWKQTGERRDFRQNFNVAVDDQQTGEQEITDKDPETTFMMIPQVLDGESAIEVVIKTKDGTSHTLTAPFKNQEWEAGKIYTYTISTESINWTYVFEVTPELRLPLGTTSGNYTVKSYRYRTQAPEVIEPVAWNAEMKDNTHEKEITGFTYSGKGTSNTSNEESNTCSLTMLPMSTSYKGDATLRNNLSKGSPDNPYDLSTDGGKQSQTTANCYIVSAAGTYSLPLVYGNAIKNGSLNRSAYSGTNTFNDYNDNIISSPGITGAGDCILVWSDAFYLFKDVKLSNNNLVFTLDKDYMQQANAIVAVRDKNKKIMWSWHIWVTEHDLSKTIGLQDYSTGTKNQYHLMPYNLGWIDGKSITYTGRDIPFTFTQSRSGKTETLTVIQAGAVLDYKDGGSTYYQWGRKDPLVALKNRDLKGRDDYRPHEVGQESYGYKCTVKKVSLGEAIQNPNVFYTVLDDTDQFNWLSNPKYYLWNNGSNDSSLKTIYDPSPRGFKIPESRAFSVFVNGNSKSEAGGTLNGYVASNGYTYYVYSEKEKQGEKIELTATGQRVDRQSKLENEEEGGLWAIEGVYYWSCYGFYNGKHYIGTSLCIRNTSSAYYYTYGFSGAQTMARPVRCIKE